MQGTNIQRGNAVQGGVWGTRAGDKYHLNEQVATNATKATRTPVGMERYLTFFLMCEVLSSFEENQWPHSHCTVCKDT